MELKSMTSLILLLLCICFAMLECESNDLVAGPRFKRDAVKQDIEGGENSEPHLEERINASLACSWIRIDANAGLDDTLARPATMTVAIILENIVAETKGGSYGGVDIIVSGVSWPGNNLMKWNFVPELLSPSSSDASFYFSFCVRNCDKAVSHPRQ